MLRICVLAISCFASCCVVTAEEQNDKRPSGAILKDLPDVAYPRTDFVVDVTKPPYSAKGDGQTDDTEPIQRAIHDQVGMHKIIYFPSGTYLVSKTIEWTKKNSAGRDAWGHTTLQGQNVATTIIRLKDATATDAGNPKAIMWCGGFGSADWFHNYVQDLTFDVGANNPGAIALQFYSNNSGAIRNCRFRSDGSSGHTGLDLAHRDMNGPLLVRNCEVIGFRIGITTGHAVNSQTFEHITLEGQRELGISNSGQSISIRNLLSNNKVPAVQTYGNLCLLESTLNGSKETKQTPAILNYNFGRVYLRDIETKSYGRALADIESPDVAACYRIRGPDKPDSLGPKIVDYHSHPITSPFQSKKTVLRLAIQEPPEPPIDPLSQWANVDDFGADPTGTNDSSQAIQKAIDSGATTVFFPGFYAVQQTILVRGKVRRLLGVGAWIDYNGQSKPDFRVVDGESSAVTFEHFSHMGGGVDVDTQRTLFFRSACDGQIRFTEKARGGRVFFEDVCTNNLQFNQQRVWARQLNVENEGLHILNDQSDLWLLGYKTERGGTLLDTRNGGRSEVLGGFSYTTTAGKLGPMFHTTDASIGAFFAEVCFNGDPFQTLIREKRGDVERTIDRENGNTTPYVSVQD